MWIKDMIQNHNGKNVTHTGASERASVSDGARQYHIRQQLKSMMPGQTLQGKVMGMNGKEIQIQIGEDMVLNARLDKEMNVDIGKILTFEVKNQTGNLLALRPLFANMGTDANVLKALDMANIPVNDTTVAMTEAMMKEGMSIDKTNLQHFYKLVANYPDSDPVSLVQLSKLGLEITPENIMQLENYKALEHQMLKGMTDILEELPAQFQAMLQEGNTGEALELYQKILQIFVDGENAEGMPSHGNLTEIEGQGTQMETSGGGTIQEAVSESADGMSKQGGVIAEQAVSEGTAEASGETVVHSEMGEANAVQEENPAQPRLSHGTLGDIFHAGERENLAALLRQVGGDQAMALENENLSMKEALQLIRNLTTAEDGSVKPEAANLLASKEFNQLLQAEISEQWMLKPKEVEKGTNVEELYQRLTGQLAKLSEALRASGKAESPLAQNVNHLQNNIDFLNQVNHLASYVQLPLKMNGQNTHGELYVYTNKKSLAKADGNVSALLHLDMEHLGPVDVYVAMQNEKVNTNFYLQDDAMLDFLQEHMHLLHARLERRGYTMHSELSVRKEEKNVMEEIMEENRNMTQVSQYSFDVRA